jgi:hypothetical protein
MTLGTEFGYHADTKRLCARLGARMINAPSDIVPYTTDRHGNEILARNLVAHNAWFSLDTEGQLANQHGDLIGTWPTVFHTTIEPTQPTSPNFALRTDGTAGMVIDKEYYMYYIANSGTIKTEKYVMRCIRD